MVSLGPGVFGGAATGDLLVGAAEGDDAAVLRLDDERALVLTTDFFTPIVDDAREWGRIAAANALSDVYAMGGRPVMALNLTAWPGETLPLSLLADVLRGGASVAAEAGCLVVGGHTIDDPEPKYGMAVVGLAAPGRLFTIDAARPGDTLVLTKAIGTGVVATAHKRGGASDDVLAAAVASMTSLNAAASEAALACGVVAATDVTGFSLLGHLHRMLRASGCARSSTPRRCRCCRARSSSPRPATSPAAPVTTCPTWSGGRPSMTTCRSTWRCCCRTRRRPAACCSRPPRRTRWWPSSAAGGCWRRWSAGSPLVRPVTSTSGCNRRGRRNAGGRPGTERT